MFCHECGARAPDHQILCENCTKLTAYEKKGTRSSKGPAAYFDLGFSSLMLRFFALLIDLSLLSVPTYGIYLLLQPLFGKVDFLTFHLQSLLPFSASFSTIHFSLVGALLGWLYYGKMESSSHQATIGKIALGIMVTDIDRFRLTFSQASFRYWLKLISAIPCFLGFLFVCTNKKKQALHDLLSASLVIKRTPLSVSQLLRRVTIATISSAIVGLMGLLAFPNSITHQPLKNALPTLKVPSFLFQPAKKDRVITGSEGVFKYTDQAGKTYYVDSKDKIPKEYQ